MGSKDATAPYPVREDLVSVHEELRTRIAAPGTWWTGAERSAIAAEARAARDDPFNKERKQALSPTAIAGSCTAVTDLPDRVVDTIHRIVTDPGRLSRSWYEKLLADGILTDASYVELAAVAILQNALAVFALAVGVTPAPLDEPLPGEPTRERPATARQDGAWVPQIPPGEDGGEDWRAVYGDREVVPQIGRALSLVPAEVRMMNLVAQPHYMKLENVIDPSYVEPDRTLDRLQTELIAARVSAINECFY